MQLMQTIIEFTFRDVQTPRHCWVRPAEQALVRQLCSIRFLETYSRAPIVYAHVV